MFDVETVTDLDEVATSKQQFLIYNADSGQCSFASNGARNQDEIMEAHKHQYETRNMFHLEKPSD